MVDHRLLVKFERFYLGAACCAYFDSIVPFASLGLLWSAARSSVGQGHKDRRRFLFYDGSEAKRGLQIYI